MSATETNVPGRHRWVGGLALASVVLPVAAVLPRTMVANPNNPSSYRFTVVALGIALVCAIITFVFNHMLAPTWLRQLSMWMASLGVLFALYLLMTLIGTCGLQVIWGSCSP